MPVTTNALEGLLAILNGNYSARWNFPAVVGTTVGSHAGVGQGVTLTYSFPTSLPSYASESGFAAFTAAEKAAARAVLKLFSDLTDLEFVEVGPQRGDLTFAKATLPEGVAGYAYYPGFGWSEGGGLIQAVSAPSDLGGAVWLDRTIPFDAAAWQPGGQQFEVLLHEVGHALGLKHSFDGTYVLPGELDDTSHTVMAYAPATGTSLVEIVGTQASYRMEFGFLHPETPMVLDVEALQALYGANTATKAGNTTYSWERGANILRTLWDGGGIDTIDCGNQVAACRIDLGEGAFSSIGLRTTDAAIRAGLGLPSWFQGTLSPDVYTGKNNLAIAKGAVIENAIGGTGNDQITGNATHNRLEGGAGRDVLQGGGGRDTLAGGDGSDRLTGGRGADVFDFDALAESGIPRASRDAITDFDARMDRIDLATIDADSVRAGDQAFIFIGGAGFSRTDASGQLRLEGGVLYASTDADADAEFSIALAGVDALPLAALIL